MRLESGVQLFADHRQTLSVKIPGTECSLQKLIRPVSGRWDHENNNELRLCFIKIVHPTQISPSPLYPLNWMHEESRKTKTGGRKTFGICNDVCYGKVVTWWWWWFCRQTPSGVMNTCLTGNQLLSFEGFISRFIFRLKPCFFSCLVSVDEEKENSPNDFTSSRDRWSSLSSLFFSSKQLSFVIKGLSITLCLNILIYCPSWLHSAI